MGLGRQSRFTEHTPQRVQRESERGGGCRLLRTELRAGGGPWVGGSLGWRIIPQAKRRRVPLLVRARAGGNQLMSASVSFSLSLFPSSAFSKGSFLKKTPSGEGLKKKVMKRV